MSAWRSLVSHARLKSLTMPAVGRPTSRRPGTSGCGGGPRTPAGGTPPACGRRPRRSRRRSSGRHRGRHERNSLGRGHRLEHDQERHADRLVEGDPVGRVGRGAAGPRVDRVPRVGQRLRDPLAHVAVPSDSCRAEHIEADTAGYLRQPGAGGFDGFLLLPCHGVPTGVGLLHSILGLGEGAEEPVGEIDQLMPLAYDRRSGPDRAGNLLARSVCSWCCRLLGRTCCHQFRRNTATECEACTRLTLRRGASSYGGDAQHP